jgi:hypothetical protein
MTGYVKLTDSAGNVINAANALPVSGTITTKASVIGTQYSVAASTSDATIIIANANRLGATVFNDSTATLYLLLASGTSSTTTYSVQLAANAIFEVPYNYTGIIRGIWASAVGSARVTEFV